MLTRTCVCSIVPEIYMSRPPEMMISTNEHSDPNYVYQNSTKSKKDDTNIICNQTKQVNPITPEVSGAAVKHGGTIMSMVWPMGKDRRVGLVDAINIHNNINIHRGGCIDRVCDEI